MKSGMGSVVILAQAFSSATRFLSWNARGPLATSGDLFQKKWAQILSLVSKADVLVIQETHGDEGQCAMAMASLEHVFSWIFSQ